MLVSLILLERMMEDRREMYMEKKRSKKFVLYRSIDRSICELHSVLLSNQFDKSKINRSLEKKKIAKNILFAIKSRRHIDTQNQISLLTIAFDCYPYDIILKISTTKYINKYSLLIS